MCSGDLPAARSKERRSVLPSIGTTPCKGSAKRCMKRVKQASNGAGSRSRNTWLKVSWLGMPCPQAQELPQERFLDRAEQRHVRAILAGGQYGAERDQPQFMQIMAGIILPRVNDLGKAGDEFFHGRASTLNPRLESSHASPSNPRLQPPAPYAIALGVSV